MPQNAAFFYFSGEIFGLGSGKVTGKPHCAKPSGKDIVRVVNADIITMDDQNPSADAITISNDRIVAIGSESVAWAAMGDYAKSYNLEGRTVLPGFFELHDHLSFPVRVAGGLFSTVPDFEEIAPRGRCND